MKSDKALSTDNKAKSERRGIQSIEIGFRILDVLRATGRAMPLKEIAELSQLSVANVHYYLVSFQKVGAVQQQAESSFYALGPYALKLGLAALKQFDILSSAHPIMQKLALETGHTVFLGVWGNKGPTIVHRVEGAKSQPLLELKIGSVLPLLSSAIGHNFLSYLPQEQTKSLLHEELNPIQVSTSLPHLAPISKQYKPKDVELIKHQTQQFNISRCSDTLIPHFTSLSAPVFSMLGEMTAAITIMDFTNALDDDPSGRTACLLIESANEISKAAGWAA